MWRIFLLPFSFLFAAVLRLRHWLYDSGRLKSYTPPIPSIVVGNLCLGGSGKTPMVLQLGEWLVNHKKLAFLSRGYGRKSKGFRWVELDEKPEVTGDEPRLFKAAFPDAAVVVDENRKHGIEEVLGARPATQAIILDDAFQHRKVKAGMNILLVPRASLNSPRWLVPAGNERDVWERYKKASVIVITKYDTLPVSKEKQDAFNSFPEFDRNRIFFAALRYSELVAFDRSERIETSELNGRVMLLITGLADGNRVKTDLEAFGAEVHHLAFRDHYDYTTNDIQKIEEKLSMFAHSTPMVVTTGKDRVKLESLIAKGMESHWYEIRTYLEFDREEELKKLIFSYVDTNSRDRKVYS